MAVRHTGHDTGQTSATGRTSETGRPFDTGRTYADGCAGAHALDLVGERWALLIVRELLFGPKRFTDLRRGLPGISPNVLSQRLQKLETYAVVTRRRLAPPAAAWVYELTDWGAELEQVIVDLGRWGARSPFRDCSADLSPDSLMLSLRTMFLPRAGDRLHARLALHVGEHWFRVEVDGGRRLEIARGHTEDADATVEADAAVLAAVLYGDRRLDEAVRSEDLAIHGDTSTVEHFLTLFSLPEPAGTG